MSSSNIAPAKKQTFSVAISTESYQNLIRNTLKDPKRANRFIASITSAVATTPRASDLRTQLHPRRWSAGRSAESFSLCRSSASIISFRSSRKPGSDREGHLLSPECSKAQFVLGYKGYVQLAPGAASIPIWTAWRFGRANTSAKIRTPRSRSSNSSKTMISASRFRSSATWLTSSI